MKASVKKTVLRTVFSERVNDDFAFYTPQQARRKFSKEVTYFTPTRNASLM